MSVFSIPVTIGVDEEAIAEEIKQDVEDKVVREITNKVENIIYDKRYSYSYGAMREEPLRKMVKEVIEEVVTDRSESIISMAANILADKLSRTKAVKEKAAAIAEEIFAEKEI